MPVKQRVKKVAVAKGLKESPKKVAAARKKAGGSNVGEYSKVAKKKFCGTIPGSFPVNSKKRCKAALAYAHNAPNPAGIKACVKRKCKDIVVKLKKKK